MEDGPLAVLEEIRGVCLVKIVPTVRYSNGSKKFLSTRLKIKSSLERTNIWLVWNYTYAFLHPARGPPAVGRERLLYSHFDP